MQNRARFIVALVALLTLGSAVAQADWYEDFEGYPAGSGLHGMGGWAGWNNDPAGDAVVTDLYAFNGVQSVAIAGAADIVQAFGGYDAGIWTLSAWMLIPAEFVGETYFIVLNTYVPNGGQNWSVQVRFTNGLVATDSPGGESLPWITGQWVELRLVINLEADTQTFYYGDSMLYQASWTDGVSGGGALQIGALDLFANGADPVFYDDIMLISDTVATRSMSLSAIKALFQ